MSNSYIRNSKPEEGTIESDRFNIALGYVGLKVLQSWVESDRHLKIAIYGTEDIRDTLLVPNEIKTQLRLEAIDRLKEDIKELIENTEFLMKKEDKTLFKTFIKKMELYDEAVIKCPLKIEETDMISKRKHIRIDEEQFKKCLDYLREIKKDMGNPLHRANLIFKTDEFDFESLKNKIIQGG